MVSGNLFDNETRQTFRTMSRIGGTGLLLYTAFIWYLVAVSQEKNLFFLIALISTGIAGYIFSSGYQNYQLIFSSYEIADEVKLRLPNGNVYVRSLLSSCKVCQISLSVYQGKGQKYFRFLVVMPASDGDLGSVSLRGMGSLRQLLKKGSIPLPMDMRVMAVLRPKYRVI